jgi:dUTP pyrophosphatase
MTTVLNTNQENNNLVSIDKKTTTLRICFNPDYKEYLSHKYGAFDRRLQYPTDIGLDLYLPEDIEIQPYETKFINLGIRCEYQNDNTDEYYGYMLYPRSSISKTKVRLANSVGVIDPNYRGYLIAAVDNISDKTQYLKQGERYFQLVFTKLTKPTTLSFVNELSETDRGSGGFGSTGR